MEDLVMQVIATEGMRGLLYLFEEKPMDAIFKIGAGGPWYQTAPAKVSSLSERFC